MKESSGISTRLQGLISSLGITKTEFGRRINLSQSFISLACSGRTNISDRTISDICKEFNVSEKWLRGGIGEMFVERSRLDEVSAFMGAVLSAEPDDVKFRLISALSKLSEEEWAMVESMAQKLAEEFGEEGG